MKKIPADFPVRPLSFNAALNNPNACRCGTCGRSWDDSIATSYTPAPSGRCPFEYYHVESRTTRTTRKPRTPSRLDLAQDLADTLRAAEGVCESYADKGNTAARAVAKQARRVLTRWDGAK